jgi:hypothetical protein
VVEVLGRLNFRHLVIMQAQNRLRAMGPTLPICRHSLTGLFQVRVLVGELIETGSKPPTNGLTHEAGAERFRPRCVFATCLGFFDLLPTTGDTLTSVYLNRVPTVIV